MPRLSLKGDARFARVLAEGRRAAAGPLVAWCAANGDGAVRVGLRVARRVGTAPVRNTMKRRLREAFRAAREDWAGRDVVVSVRAHDPRPFADYVLLIGRLHASLSRYSGRGRG